VAAADEVAERRGGRGGCGAQAAADAAALHQATLAQWETATAADQAERRRLADELAARDAALQTAHAQLAHLDRHAEDAQRLRGELESVLIEAERLAAVAREQERLLGEAVAAATAATERANQLERERVDIAECSAALAAEVSAHERRRRAARRTAGPPGAARAVAGSRCPSPVAH
jgi:chromosome segregation ATPase